MKRIPTDPWALQARVMDAVIGDILDGGNRFQAMHEISKQSSRDGGGDRNPPSRDK